MTSVKIFSAIIFLAGALLRYWMNRRRFNRKNFTGTEIFRNYEHKTGAETFESVIKIIAWLLMVAGASLFLMMLVVGSGR